MRYTRYKTSISKIYDGEIEDLDLIKKIVHSVHKNSLNCSIRLSTSGVMDNVQILSVADGSFVWRMTKNGSALRNTSKLEDLQSLEVNTSISSEVKLNSPPNRWAFLDPSSDIDEND